MLNSTLTLPQAKPSFEYLRTLVVSTFFTPQRTRRLGKENLPSLPHDLFDHGIRIPLMLRDFRRKPRHSAISKLCARFFEHRIAQHLHKALLPVFDAFLQRAILFLPIALTLRNGLG